MKASALAISMILILVPLAGCAGSDGEVNIDLTTEEIQELIDDNIDDFLNNTTVPVEDAMRQLGGGAAPEVFLDIVYVDDDLRVSKLEDGSTFVYQRC